MAVDIGLDEGTREAIPIDFVDAGDWEDYAAGSPERTRAFARACGFEAKPGQSLLEPGENGALERVLFGVEAQGARQRDPFLAGKLATLLPPGVYRFDHAPADPEAAALAFLLSRYRFSRYVAPKTERARLCAPKGVDAARLARIVRAVVMGRDLVNTPANDMGPEALVRRRARIRRTSRRDRAGRRRRGAAHREFSADPRRRARQRAGAASRRFRPRPRGRAEGDAGRQGRVFRHRRARHQAFQRDAADEEGHGRRGGRAVAGVDAAGGRGSRAAAGDPADRRKFAVGLRLPARRRISQPQGAFGRDRQHRRGRAARAGRRAGAGIRGRSPTCCSISRR